MKIIQIVAAYKPAYIYGGPTMSVAKLCETLVKNNPACRTGSEQGLRSNDMFNLEVFTTTANGKTELNVIPNQTKIVDSVKVTYFKRLTKDHTHFSPALLFALRTEILNQSRKLKAVPKASLWEKTAGLKKNNEQRTTNNELIIHIHAWWNLVSIFSCAIAKWYRITVVLSPRGMLTTYTSKNRNTSAKNIIHKLLGKKLLEYCHIHATSEKEKQDILSIITPKSITVIPNLVELESEVDVEDKVETKVLGNLYLDSVSLSMPDKKMRVETQSEQRSTTNEQDQSSFIHRLSPEELTKTINKQSVQSINLYNQTLSEKHEKRTFKLIFLSRIEQKKGLEILFDALTEVNFNWTLTIGGSGEEKYVESLKLKVESLKIEENIHWIGQVKNKDKFNLLTDHDLMVLTSYNENFANVVVESLSVGTTVLLSNEVGLADYVEEKKLGWITDLNPYDIKEQLIEAFDSVALRHSIRETAPEIIFTDFDPKNLIEKYCSLYAQINDH